MGRSGRGGINEGWVAPTEPWVGVFCPDDSYLVGARGCLEFVHTLNHNPRGAGSVIGTPITGSLVRVLAFITLGGLSRIIRGVV